MLVACAQIVDAGFDGVALEPPSAPTETSRDAAENDSTASNTAPEARDGTLVVVEGSRKQGRLPSFDADGDGRQHVVVAPPKRGLLDKFDPATGEFEYASQSGNYGDDSFTYQVNDGRLDANEVGTIDVTVVARGPLRAEAGVLQLPADGYSLLRGLDIEGDTAAVGTTENGWGLVYVIHRDAAGSWKLSQRIDEELTRYYGTDLALSGDWMVVAGGGAAYFYKRPSQDADFALKQRIDAVPSQVALEGDIAVIGEGAVATSRGGGISNIPGAASVYRRQSDDQWQLEAQIPAPHPETEDRFGWSLDIANGALVTTAAVRDPNASAASALYVVSQKAGAWTVERRFDADPASPFGTFGSDVAAHADKILVSCCSRRASGAYAYVREESGWQARGPLEPPDGEGGLERFVFSMALHERAAIITRRPEGPATVGTGYVYHYADFGWHYSGRELLGTTEGRNDFGYSVAFDGVTAVITASFESGGQGAVYFFGIEPPIGQ
jgi:hypothetical protein